MKTDSTQIARVEAAGEGGSVTINQSPKTPSVTINQYGGDGAVAVNQSAQGGQDVNCDARPVVEGSTVTTNQSGETHSMISPANGGGEDPALSSRGGGTEPVGESSGSVGGGAKPAGGSSGAGGGSEPAGRKERAKETRRRRSKGLGGLQLEKTGIWTVRCLINGKRVSKSTGTRDRGEAEQFAKRFLAPYVKDDAARTFENIQAAVMTERQLAEMREAEGPQLKLADAWGEYEKSPMRRDLASSTLDGKSQVCRMFVEYMGRVFPEVTEVRHVTRFHTENYLNYLRNTGAVTLMD